MSGRFARTEALLGKRSIEILSGCRVAVFGAGGVGGYCIEALARSGIGTLDITDHDTVDITNINRQIIASDDTVGRYKTDVIRERIIKINPSAKLEVHRVFFSPENAGEYNFHDYDYIVDAIDSVSGKIELIKRAKSAGVPIISSMGTGNKLDPCRFEVDDIYNTSVCPLAKVIRRLCRENGIEKLKVVYSKEPPVSPVIPDEKANTNTITAEKKQRAPASCAFVPPVAGLIMAGEVIKDLIFLKSAVFDNQKPT